MSSATIIFGIFIGGFIVVTLMMQVLGRNLLRVNNISPKD